MPAQEILKSCAYRLVSAQETGKSCADAKLLLLFCHLSLR